MLVQLVSDEAGAAKVFRNPLFRAAWTAAISHRLAAARRSAAQAFTAIATQLHKDVPDAPNPYVV